jgi:methylmalonyl-CoA mutase N-terminal domain/subunit
MKRETDWGHPIKEAYTPEDVRDIDYLTDLNDPGKSPYTRGTHPQGYRSKDPSKRMTVGFGSASDTNKRLKYLRSVGEEGGISIVVDKGSQMCIDSDHPMARDEAGLVGTPMASVADMQDLFDGLPLVGQAISFNTTPASAPVNLAMFVVLCEKLGVDITEVRGQMGMTAFSSVFGQEDAQPFDLCYKVSIDGFEYMARNRMKMYYQTASQHCRESGLNLAHEVGVATAIFRDLIDRMLDRGLSIDDFAGRVTNLASIGIRILEEIAKIRALRKIWAKMVSERYGAQNPRSCHLNISVHTSGTSLTYQQPLNNIIRGAIECLAGALAGCTAFGVSTYDEPHCEPTEFASRMALNTEYIVLYETGVADTVDPLGGSYYLEYLTKKLEEEGYQIFNKIEEMGGLPKAIETGWYEEVLMSQRMEREIAIKNRDIIKIGVNELVIPPEEEEPIQIQEVPQVTTEAIVRQLREFKERRDLEKLQNSLQMVYRDAQKGEKFNLMPSMIEAARSDATLGEIWGAIRLGNGLSYDPFDMIESPFEFTDT